VNKYVKFFPLSFILIAPQSLGFNANLKISWGSLQGQRGNKQGSFRVGIIPGRDHSRSGSIRVGIIPGRDHSRVDFGYHFGVGDHFGVEIISGAVQLRREGTF